ncbi:MAG: hypothetical protein HRT72_03870 [Flavobacteriales bacterium]|nr:hypothetical protein [Flavobacteriales bacterium]
MASNKSLYFLIISFIVVIIVMEFGGVEFWNISESVVEAPVVKGELKAREEINFKSELNFRDKKNSSFKYIDNDQCEDPVAIALDKRVIYGPSFNILYSKSVDLNQIDNVELSACFKQLDNTLEKASFVISITNENDEHVFWENYTLINLELNKWKTTVCQFEPKDIAVGAEYKLNCFIWNQGKERFLVDNFKINVTSK